MQQNRKPIKKYFNLSHECLGFLDAVIMIASLVFFFGCLAFLLKDSLRFKNFLKAEKLKF